MMKFAEEKREVWIGRYRENAGQYNKGKFAGYKKQRLLEVSKFLEEHAVIKRRFE